MTDPKLVENKIARQLTIIFGVPYDLNDVNDQIKLAKMPRYMKDDFDREYGQRPPNDMLLDDYMFGS
jgi:hypothetical protein